MFVMRSDGMKQRPCHRAPRFNRENPRRQHLAGHDSCLGSVSCLFGAFACHLPFRRPLPQPTPRARCHPRPVRVRPRGDLPRCSTVLPPPNPAGAQATRRHARQPKSTTRRATIRPHLSGRQSPWLGPERNRRERRPMRRRRLRLHPLSQRPPRRTPRPRRCPTT